MPKGWNDGAWSSTFADYMGRTVALSCPYNVNNGNLLQPGLTIVRDAECIMDTLIVGRVEDGTRRTWPIAPGTTQVSAPQLATQGFSTIQDVTSAGVTVGRSGG